jgi:Zn finger protein HypA/HybF involved in hydrogenase expression
MKEKIAYLRGLMDGMKLAEDDNTRLLRAIADCLDAMADEIETESARTDILEGEIDEMNEDIDQLDEIVGFLIEEEEEDCDCDCCGEDWEDDFDFFTCPNCGEVVPLDEDALSEEADPICPKCNSKLFGE